jgi:hypothetical protein
MMAVCCEIRLTYKYTLRAERRICERWYIKHFYELYSNFTCSYNKLSGEETETKEKICLLVGQFFCSAEPERGIVVLTLCSVPGLGVLGPVPRRQKAYGQTAKR